MKRTAQVRIAEEQLKLTLSLENIPEIRTAWLIRVLDQVPTSYITVKLETHENTTGHIFWVSKWCLYWRFLIRKSRRRTT